MIMLLDKPVTIAGHKCDTLEMQIYGFYFVGVWASLAGSLFGNALSGRRAIQALRKRQGKKFLIR